MIALSLNCRLKHMLKMFGSCYLNVFLYNNIKFDK